MKIVKCCSILFALLLMVGLLSLGQHVFAAEVTKTGNPSTYLDSLTIGGHLITDCTEEMHGEGWWVRKNAIFLQGYNGGGIIIDTKSNAGGMSVVVVTSSKIDATYYGIHCDTSLYLTLDGSTLDITSGYVGICCNGILNFQDGEDPGKVNISCSNKAKGHAAISKAGTTAEYMALHPNIRLNINWITESNEDVYGLESVSYILGDSSDNVGVASIVVKNKGSGNGYAAKEILGSNQSHLNELKKIASVNSPDQEHLYINMNAIDDLAISVTAPAVGNTPARTATASSNLITIEEVGWLRDDAYPLSTTAIFEAGHKYCVWFFYTLKDGVEFVQDANITVNGNPATIVESYRIGYEFYTESPITSVSLTVTEPKAGMTPDYTATFPSGAPYFSDAYNEGNYRNDIGWWNENTHNQINPDTAVFQAGSQYKVYVYLTAQDGYAFTDSTTATLNGQPAEASLENGQLLVQYTFPKLTAITRGDLNSDGSVNQKDLAMLSKYMRNKTLYPLDEYAMAAADINGDGSVNQKDLAILSKYMRNPTAYPLP